MDIGATPSGQVPAIGQSLRERMEGGKEPDGIRRPNIYRQPVDPTENGPGPGLYADPDRVTGGPEQDTRIVTKGVISIGTTTMEGAEGMV